MMRTPPGLPLASRMVLEHLRGVERKSGSDGTLFDYSMAECAEELSISQRTVSRSLRQLQEMHVISFTPGKGRHPTRVQFTHQVPDDIERAGDAL